MPQQLASSFSDAGHHVLYIDNTGVRTPNLLKDKTRILSKLNDVFSSSFGFKCLSPNLTILSPLVLPFPYSLLAYKLNSFIVKRKIDQWRRQFPLSTPLHLVTFLPTPLAIELSQMLSQQLLIYYCANNMYAGDPAKSGLLHFERCLFRSADYIFTISDSLSTYASSYTDSLKVIQVPPGLDDRLLSSDYNQPFFLPPTSRKRLVYLGALSTDNRVLDIELICSIASEFSHCEIILAGPQYFTSSPFSHLPNVTLLGRLPHSQVLSLLLQSDVALIPYLLNDFTRSVSTCKVNEYLYSGLPVVSTALPEIKKVFSDRPDLVKVAETKLAFLAQISNALSDISSQSTQARSHYAISRLWSRQANIIITLLEKKSRELLLNSPLRTSNNLLAFLRNARLRTYSLTSSLLILYLFLFVSPFFPFLGSLLTPSSNTTSSEALLVLTGDATDFFSSYSLVNRAPDILNYLHHNPSSQVYLTTAKTRHLQETAFLRSYLIDAGVAPSQLHLLTPSATTTQQHTDYAASHLHSFRSISVVASPLRTRRAALLLAQALPTANVSMIRPSDSSPSAYTWFPSSRLIYTIFYEYAALLHNCIANIR